MAHFFLKKKFDIFMLVEACLKFPFWPLGFNLTMPKIGCLSQLTFERRYICFT